MSNYLYIAVYDNDNWLVPRGLLVRPFGHLNWVKLVAIVIEEYRLEIKVPVSFAVLSSKSGVCPSRAKLSWCLMSWRKTF